MDKRVLLLLTLLALPLAQGAIIGDDIQALGHNATFTGYFVGGTGTGNYISASSVGSTSTPLYIGNQKILVDGDSIASAGGWTKDGSNVFLTTSSDSVGIGTSSPSSNLEIRQTRDAADITMLTLTTDGTGDIGDRLNILFRQPATGGALRDVAQITAIHNHPINNRGSIAFSTSTSGVLSEAMRINADGDVGIGTILPGTRLHVNGVITATGGTSTNWNTAYGWGNHGTAGYITSVTAGSGLSGGGTSGAVTLNTDAPTCGANQYSYWTGSAWACRADQNTQYSAGNGISLSGTTFSVAGGTGLTQQASGLALDTGYTDNRYVNIAGDTMSNTLTISRATGNSGPYKLVLDEQRSGTGTAHQRAWALSGGASGELMVGAGSLFSFESGNPTLQYFYINTDAAKLDSGQAYSGANFVIDSGGNVGIGTTSPTNTLDVDGTARIRSITNAQGNILTISGTGVIQQRTPAEIRSDIGAGTGDGSVTSVDVSGGTTGITTTGGPITDSGTITLGGTLGVAHGGTGASTAAGARTNLGAVNIGGDTMSGDLTLGNNMLRITGAEGNNIYEIRGGQNVATGIVVRATSNPPNNNPIFAVESSGSATRFGVTQGNGVWARDGFYVGTADTGDLTGLNRVWHEGDFTNTDINNWNTAYAERGSQIAGTGLSWNSGNLNIDNPFNPSGTYANLRAQATTKGDVGLGSVPNLDFRTYGLGTTSTVNSGTLSSLSNNVFFAHADSGGDADWSTSNGLYPMGIHWQRSTSVQAQLAIGYGASGNLVFRQKTGASTWTPWKKTWDESDFTSTNINNWNTAYGWGNHGAAGYISSVTAGSGLSGGGTSGAVTLNTDAPTCGAGQYSYWTGSAWACRTDQNTQYSAGNGISLSGTTFSVAGGTGLTQQASGLALDTGYTDGRYVNQVSINGEDLADLRSMASFLHTDTNARTFTDLAFNRYNGAISGPLIIETGITNQFNMFMVEVEIYEYAASKGPHKIAVLGYNRGGSNNDIVNPSYTYEGPLDDPLIRLAQDGSGNLVIAFQDNSYTFSYPYVHVTSAKVTHSTMSNNYGTGWSISYGTDPATYPYSITVNTRAQNIPWNIITDYPSVTGTGGLTGGGALSSSQSLSIATGGVTTTHAAFTDQNLRTSDSPTFAGLTSTSHVTLSGGHRQIVTPGGYLDLRPSDVSHGLILRDHTGGSTSWAGIRASPAGALQMSGSGSYSDLVVHDNGNVGIGVLGPNAPLVVYGGEGTYAAPTFGSGNRGAIHIRSLTSNRRNAITFSPAGTDSAQAGIYVHQDNSAGTHMYLATTNSYATGPQARLTILNNGRVGIGTTGPDHLLDVSGRAAATQIRSNTYEDSGGVVRTAYSSGNVVVTIG